MNNQGVTGWSNNQAGLNTQMQNFDDEENWEWPHLRGNMNRSNTHIAGLSTQGGINQGITNQVNTQAMNANAPIAPYSESERAVIPNYEPINNDVQLREAQNDLKTSDPGAYWKKWYNDNQYDGNIMGLPEWQEYGAFRDNAYYQSPQYAQDQVAQNNARTAKAYAARINQDATDRLRGVNPNNGYTAAQNLQAKQLRQTYSGINAYDRQWRINNGIPNDLLDHPFNLY